MPAKGQKASEETRQRISDSHWTKRNNEQREQTIATLREKRALQVHPSLAGRGYTTETVAEAKALGLKWCSGECKAFIPISEFGGTKKRLAWCRKCFALYMRAQRAAKTPEERTAFAHSRSLRKYGVNQEWYQATIASQEHACGLCGGAQDGKPKFAIDHDHKTGRVRGLLCFKCNTALERFETVADWPLRVLAYLAKYK